MADEQINMMMSVLPGTMTGFAALNSGLVSINNAFLNMTKAFDNQFGLVNTILATTGVVVAQLGMDAMDAFGKFEQGMKIVQMVSGQTRTEIEQLSQTANQFSVQYRVDIDQITEGLQTLGRAGLNSASEQTEVLQNGLNTAKLEGRDLNGVLQELIQNTALLGGNLKSSDFGEQSEYVNDLLVATSMTAPITTHDVSETLKYSGGIAAAAGANIETEEGKAILEDYMGAIAAFAQKGVTGSIAGTALRAFFNKPATQDSSVTDALASIKLKPEYLWEDDEETMKPVSEQIGIITKQMDKLDVSTMDRLQIWSKIVGGKMGQQMMKLDSESIKDITKDIQAADDAGNLASNSMKTYEANVKALGESGEVLKRNVGQSLVFFANPILEFINKITQFGNQDFMGWPIAITIIGFVGMLITKVRGAISVIRSEIGTLMQSLKAGEQYFLGKTGKVIGPNGEVISSDSSKEKESSTTSATTLAGYTKQYTNQIQKEGALTLESFKQARVSAEKIGIAGYLSKLTKQTSLGIPEGQIWGTALKNNVLTKEEIDALNKGLSFGLKPRQLANLVGIDNIIPRVAYSESAMKDIGLPVKTFNQAMVNTFGDLTGKKGWLAQMKAEASRELAKTNIATASNQANALNKVILAKQKEIEADNKSSMSAKENANTQKEMATEVTSATRAMQQRVVQEFNEMSAAVSASVSGMSGKLPNRMYRDSRTDVRGLLYNFSESPYYKMPQMSNYNTVSQILWGNPYGLGPVPSATSYGNIPSIYSTNKFMSPLLKEWVNSGLGKAFGYGLTDDQMAHYLAANRIPGYLNYSDKAQEIARNNIKTYPDIGRDSNMPVYGPANDEGVKNFKEAQEKQRQASIGVGAGAGSVEAAKDAARRAKDVKDEDAARRARLVQQVRTQYAEDDAASTKALQEHQEKVKKAQLATVQYGEEALTVDQQRLAVEEEILMMARTRAESESVSTSGMHGKGVPQSEAERFRQDAASGRYKTEDTLGKAGYVSKSSPDQVADKNLGKSFVGLREARAAQIKDQMDQNSQHTKLLNQVNDIAKRNKSLSSTYMEGIAQNQKHAALFRELNKGGYGGTPYYINSGGRVVYDSMYAEKDAVRVVNSYTPVNPMAFHAKPPEEAVKQGFGAAFRQSFSERINRDRTGSFLSFGREMGSNGVMRSATKGLSGLANKALNLSDAFGGPLMIAIMAVSTAIQMWQKAFQEYCEDLKEAGNQLKAAYSEWNTAEDELERTFREGNPDATDEEIETMILDTYSTMGSDMANALNNGQKEWFKHINTSPAKQDEYVYDEEKDDGSTKIKEEKEKDEAVQYEEALKENTGALYSATAQLSTAMSKYTTKATDDWWGLDGWTGDFSDAIGAGFDYLATGGEGSKFTDNNEFLLTARQKDENYAGHTEMAGLMLEDFKDAQGDWLKGLRTMMGSDADSLAQIMPEKSKTFLSDMAFNAYHMGSANNARIQTSMKNDSKTWKSLAKEIAKQEMKDKKGIDKDNKTRNKKIEGLITKLNTSMGGHFTRTQILQAAYLQEMQDMYQVAQNVMVPIISQNAQTAMNSLVQLTDSNTKDNQTRSSTYGTEQITSTISAMVAQIALAQSADAVQNKLLIADPESTDINGDGYNEEDKAIIELAQNSKDGKDFLKQASQMGYDSSAYGATSSHGVSLGAAMASAKGQSKDPTNTAAIDYILQNYLATAKMTVYGYDAETANQFAKEEIQKAREKGLGTMDMFNTYAKNYQSKAFQDQLEAAYLNSGEEEGSGSGGGGSGSGDKDKGDTGTRKERVDLVLCNRKTIPKLNVNLFKKPPSFTILNKNFKLRDVRINSEDKPKAIMAAIKNSFIDIQKRTDPKIIQDEDAVYDPAAATDGTNVPSGSAKTNTS